MTDQAGYFLGADLLLRSSQPIDDRIAEKAREQDLSITESIEFSSVVIANGNFQLSHIKAVDPHYPLLSHIRVSTSLYGDEMPANQGPPQGEAWLAPRLFSALNIKLNDMIEIGEHKLRASRVLKHDPGQASSLITIAPRLLMNQSDVQATGIIQPGSRVTYVQGYAGDIKDRQAFEQWLKPLLSPTQKLSGGSEGSEAVNNAMQKARQYLSLSSMLSVMLSGIAIAMTANRYGQRHFDQAALMRCMGASQSTIVRLFSAQLMMLGSMASFLGVLLGYLTQEGLALILNDLFNGRLPVAGLHPLAIGFISGLITLTGFSLPALLRLKQVSPLRVLRKDLSPLPVHAWIVYSLATASLVLLMWWQSNQLTLTVIVLLVTVASIGLLFILTLVMVELSKRLMTILSGPWKAGLQQLLRNRRSNQLQILTFGLSLLILMTIYLIRSDLLDRWQAQLPANAPNHFVINIQPYEVDRVKDFFSQQKIGTEGLYPMVRGRISRINGQDVTEVKQPDGGLDASLQRELNLSWATGMQANNQLVEGRWWHPLDVTQSVISIEQGLARRLQLKLGDTLDFLIAEQTISARIVNIRSVQWDSFQPNFYIIFPPGIIDEYPVTYISSFYLDESQKNILNQLVRDFPTLTVLEIDDIMQQVRSIMNRVSLAVEYVMLFVLFAGCTVLIASMQAGMDQRNHNAIIMRTLGASRQYLRRSLFSEFAILGLLAGILAVAGTELIAYLLYQKVFELDYQPHLALWIAGPVISILVIIALSWFYMRRVPRLSPMKILQYNA